MCAPDGAQRRAPFPFHMRRRAEVSSMTSAICSPTCSPARRPYTGLNHVTGHVGHLGSDERGSNTELAHPDAVSAGQIVPRQRFHACSGTSPEETSASVDPGTEEEPVLTVRVLVHVVEEPLLPWRDDRDSPLPTLPLRTMHRHQPEIREVRSKGPEDGRALGTRGDAEGDGGRSPWLCLALQLRDQPHCLLGIGEMRLPWLVPRGEARLDHIADVALPEQASSASRASTQP
jgi:hypothetical protein